MNIDELEEALEELLGDGFTLDEDSHGQLVIWTGLCQDDDGELVEFLADEDLEEDLDIDPDLTPLDDLDEDEE